MNAKTILSKIASLILLGLISTSCSPTLRKMARYDMDDMYAVHDKEIIEATLASQALVNAYYKEQNMQTWSEMLGIKQANISNPAAEVYLENEMYNTPYGEKIRALYADSYQLPSSYYAYSSVLEELSNYDPDDYTVIIDDDGNLIIQPKYIYSIYGSWGVNNYNLHPWRYGYNRGWRPHTPYWYYNSWYYDYSWNYGWDYGFYWGYNPMYIYGYHRPHVNLHMNHGWYRPHYANGFKNTIVKYQNMTPAQMQNLQVGTRQKNGSTVGSQSKSTYNRGTSSSSSSSSSSNSSVVRSGASSSGSSTSTQKSSGTANKIGR